MSPIGASSAFETTIADAHLDQLEHGAKEFKVGKDDTIDLDLITEFEDDKVIRRFVDTGREHVPILLLVEDRRGRPCML